MVSDTPDLHDLLLRSSQGDLDAYRELEQSCTEEMFRGLTFLPLTLRRPALTTVVARVRAREVYGDLVARWADFMQDSDLKERGDGRWYEIKVEFEYEDELIIDILNRLSGHSSEGAVTEKEMDEWLRLLPDEGVKGLP